MARILVADDSEFARDHARRILEEAGHSVILAANGHQATIAYAAERPDAAVLDAVMPVVDGLQATAAIVASDPGARVVIVLPSDRHDQLEAARSGGARVVLEQPGAWGRLVETLAGVLAEGELQTGAATAGDPGAVASPSPAASATALAAPVERRPVAMISSVLATVLALTVLVYGSGLQPASATARALAAASQPERPLATIPPRALPTVAPSATPGLDWPNAPVPSRARTQAQTYATYAMPDDWANYGQEFTAFCQQYLGFDCDTGHTRSLGEAMVSIDVIRAFGPDQGDARAAIGDVWVFAIRTATASAVLAPYTSPRAWALPASLRGDGWLAPFAGVPGFIVNTPVLARRNLPIPRTWADLAKPIYRGLVGMGKPGASRPATAAFLALALGHGGTLTSYEPVLKLAKALALNLTDPATSVTDIEAGSPPIDVAMDYDLVWMDHQATADGVMSEVVIPQDGSLYVPGALIVNGHDTSHMDMTKMFLDWLLSDDGQSIFAQYGVHPIRAVVGDPTYTVPVTDRELLLPAATYAATKLYDLSAVDPNAIYDFWTKGLDGG